jgi:hypothetical protein
VLNGKRWAWADASVTHRKKAPRIQVFFMG